MTWLFCIAFLLQAASPPQQTSAPASGPAAAEPASRSQQGSQASELDPDSLPVSLERIQKRLATEPAIKLDSGKPVFRVEVLGKNPTIEDILGPDYLKGPVSWGGMSHQEFLNMVTPQDVRGYAAFSNKEAFTVAATSVALQWALQKAIQKLSDARDARKEREQEAARQEVLDALNALQHARAKAGLPPK
jgi:hypothetical protein